MKMHQKNQVTHYVPELNEPSIFGESVSSIALEWASWFAHKEKYPDADPLAYELKAPNYDVVAAAKELRMRLRVELKGIRVELPDEPPSMYTQRGHLSLAWVLDTARRENLPPEEAVTMALALRKM